MGVGRIAAVGGVVRGSARRRERAEGEVGRSSSWPSSFVMVVVIRRGRGRLSSWSFSSSAYRGLLTPRTLLGSL